MSKLDVDRAGEVVLDAILAGAPVERAVHYLREGSFEIYTNGSGEAFWGNAGAGVLPICRTTKRILVSYRSKHVNEPNTWGVFGGAIDDGESPPSAAKRELKEELGYTGPVDLVPAYVFRSSGGGFTYHNFLGLVEKEFYPRLNWETEDTRWVTLDELRKLPRKHFGLEALLSNSMSLIKQHTR